MIYHHNFISISYHFELYQWSTSQSCLCLCHMSLFSLSNHSFLTESWRSPDTLYALKSFLLFLTGTPPPAGTHWRTITAFTSTGSMQAGRFTTRTSTSLALQLLWKRMEPMKVCYGQGWLGLGSFAVLVKVLGLYGFDLTFGHPDLAMWTQFQTMLIL